MSGFDIKASLSQSLSSGAAFGNRTVVGGGGKTANTFLWVLGGVAVLGILAFLFLRKGK